MKCLSAPVLISLLLCCCLAVGADNKNRSKNSEGRRIFGIGPFRPFMRVLGMMGLPLLPLLLLRQLLVGAGAANQQGAGAGAGMGSLGALGLLGPFGAGAGLGGIRPGLGGAGGGGLAGLFGGAGGAGAGAGAGGNAGATALFLQKRSAADKLQPLLGALARLERAVDQYDLGAPDCQRRIVCEIHRKTIKPSLGSLTEKLIQAFG